MHPFNPRLNVAIELDALQDKKCLKPFYDKAYKLRFI